MIRLQFKTEKMKFDYISEAAKHLGYPLRPSKTRFINYITADERDFVCYIGGGEEDEQHISKGCTEFAQTEKAEPKIESFEGAIDIDAEFPPKKAAPKKESAPVDDADALGKAIAGMLGKSSVNEDKVLEILNKEFGNKMAESFVSMNNQLADRIKLIEKPRQIEIKTAATQETKNIGVQHYNFYRVLRNSRLGLHSMLVGPAGSFKTSAGEAVAEALNREVNSISVNSQTTKSDLLGFTDATGVYRSSSFRDAYENGKIFILDEIDAANGNVLLVLNSGLSNGGMNFPDGRVQAHKDFVCIGTANTWANGNGDRTYNHRKQLDKASTDRFKKIAWGYDEAMEMELAGNKDWCKKVQAIRKAVLELRIESQIVTPRATLDGSLMLADGAPESEVLEETIFFGMSDDEIKKIKARI